MTTLEIKEMSCNHCVERIHNLLEDMKVVHTISLENKSIDVDTSVTSLEKIIEELDDIGFTALKK